ncbi:MAG TPA: tetratricopeptide repeat protein [Myxococcota bacterium]|jgi:predicted Zn-dependent protease
MPAKPAPPAAKHKKKPVTRDEKIAAVMAGELTFAEAMGLTRTEAYGMAFVAHRWFSFGQVVRAKRILEGLIVANPKDAYFHALLGGICGREGNDEEALKHYDEAIKLDSKNLTARVNRADLLLRKGNLGKALEDLVAATKLDPKGKTPLGKRALVLARTTSSALHAVLKKRAAAKAAAPRR